jgi:hypothetical protein
LGECIGAFPLGKHVAVVRRYEQHSGADVSHATIRCGPRSPISRRWKEAISNYVVSSTQLADLHGILVAEQEDDEEEDLKDLVKDMGLEDDEVARFRVAIVELPRVKARVAKEAKEAEEAKQTEEATGRTHG